MAADLIAKSRRETRERGLPKITKEVLADIADEFLAVSPDGKANPFRIDVGFDPNAVTAIEAVPILPKLLRAPRDRTAA